MRLVTFRQAGVERLGVEIEGGELLATSDLGAGMPATMADLLADAPHRVAAVRGAVDARPPAAEPIERAEIEILAPVPRPGKIVAIGLNYRDHAREGGVDL